MDDNTSSEEIASHNNSTVLIDHTRDDNGINLLNTEEESDVTSIQYISGTNGISINEDENFIHKYYVPFLPAKNNEDAYSRSKYDSAKRRVRRNQKIILDLLWNKSKSFEWRVSLLLFVINETKLSSYMAQNSEYINSSNQKITPMIRWSKWFLT